MITPKLIRDLIPQILEKKGVRFTTHISLEEEFQQKLREKLQEECQEFLESGSLEELADILEVVYALAEKAFVSKDELEKLRKQKKAERGGFTKRIILDSLE